MGRGGVRAGAGRKADPNSARQRKLAAKASTPAKAVGLTTPDGAKAADAGPTWPFGTGPAEEPVAEQKLSFKTPIEFWEHVLQDPGASVSAKQTAAYSLAPYVHAKIAPQGKKEAKNEAAKKASRFSSSAPPKLVAAGGKRI